MDAVTARGAAGYVLQEPGSRFRLEDSSGFLLLEAADSALSFASVSSVSLTLNPV